MLSRVSNALLFLAALAPVGHCTDNTIVRDVAIIGGGASGTYAAVRLRDLNQSLILIEKEGILGGHVNTYHDPDTNQALDYGVLIYHDLQITKDFFDRLRVPWGLSPIGSSPFNPVWLDAKTASPVNYTSPNATSGILAYAEQLSQYPDIEQGFFLPEPVPEDLLLPFGQFLEKYPDAQSAARFIFNYGQGLGDFLNQPTLYVFKNFGTDVIRDAASNFIVTKNGNDDIYDRALKFLGRDVLLNSQVVFTKTRNDSGVELSLRTPNGQQTVKAKKLLITIPPTIGNMRPFALNDEESSIFSQFINTGYYTSVVKNTGLPPGFRSSSISVDLPFNLPHLPGVYGVQSTENPGLFDIKFGSPYSLPTDYVQKKILAYVDKLQENGYANKTTEKPELVAFASHAPFELTVSPKAITDGFYKDLYALQGGRSTWYTGAAFHTQDSALLWNFTETNILPHLVE